MQRSYAWIFLCLSALSCRSAGVAPARAPDAPTPPSQAQTSAMPADYARASTGAELRALTLRDLEVHAVDRAYAGLKAFTVAHLEEGHGSRGRLVFEEAEPVLLFQFHGGDTRINAVKELGRLLAGAADQDVADLYSLFDRSDVDRIRRAMEDEKGVLHPDTVHLSPDLRAHADFFAAYLEYQELRNADSANPTRARAISERLARAREVFARTGQEEPTFLSLLVSAQALELAGITDESTELWIAAANSSYWPKASADVRAAIGARITSYREQVKQDVEAEVADERRAELDALRAAYEQENAEALARIAELEAAVASAARELEVAQSAEVATLRQELDRMFTLARLDRTGVVLERLGDLDSLVREATLTIGGEPGLDWDYASWRSRADVILRLLSAGSDLVTLWQASSSRTSS